MPRHTDKDSERVAGAIPAGSPAFWPQEDFPQGILDGDFVRYVAATELWERQSSLDFIAEFTDAFGGGGGSYDQDLNTDDSPAFVTVKLSGLTDGRIPYHVNDATGLADGPLKSDVDDAVSKAHASGSDNQDLSGLVEKVTGYSLVADTEIAKIHALHADDQDLSGLVTKEATSPDPSGLVPEYDETGNLIRSTKLASDIHALHADDVTIKTGGSPLSLSTQELSLVNNAVSPGTITEIDTGTLDNSDTKVPTNGTVYEMGLARATKTTATMSVTVGTGGDYATFALAMAAVPDLLAHNVTITLLKGTTLTETCNVQNKHALVSGVSLTVQSEKYYPTGSTAIPTADGAGATYLTDTSVFTNNDEYNGCWVLIVDGTGTDNGFVPITDTTAADGRIIVASWPGTQPDNTSRYIIVGALIDATGLTLGAYLLNNTASVTVNGIGVKDSTSHGIQNSSCISTTFGNVGVFNCQRGGIFISGSQYAYICGSGLVKNNQSSAALQGAITISATVYVGVDTSGISDNNLRGIYVRDAAYAQCGNNFGDGNGTWGAYADNCGRVRLYGTECSGSSGNHSNGTGDGSLAY